MTSAAIEANALTKLFGSTTAVTDLDLFIPAGHVLGLLGPNGSGKTTTVQMLATLIQPTSGEARVLGMSTRTQAAQIRRRLGLTGQFTAVDPNLTVRENLVFIARLLGYGRRDSRHAAADLLEQFSLTASADRPARSYSGGMRRRLDLAACLLGTPDVLFLDEPTTGLDPVAREQLWESIRAQVARGCTVLLTTQYLEEADQLADSIVIIDQGRKIAEGTPAQLKRLAGDPTLTLRTRYEEDGAPLRELLYATASTDPVISSREATIAISPDHVAAVIRDVDEAGIELDSISLRDPDLDDVFRQLTKKGQAR